MGELRYANEVNDVDEAGRCKACESWKQVEVLEALSKSRSGNEACNGRVHGSETMAKSWLVLSWGRLPKQRQNVD